MKKGFTLLELLVVLAISSLLVSGLLSLYLQTKEHFTKNNALQEIAEEIGLINLLWGRAIWGAGYVGETNWNTLCVYMPTSAHCQTKFVEVYEANDSRLPSNIQQRIKSNTQAVELRQMSFVLTSLVESANEGASEVFIQTHEKLDLAPMDFILIADFNHAERNQIANVQKYTNQISRLQLAWPLHSNYHAGAYLGAYWDRFYFIGDTKRKFPDGMSIYGLYIFNENGMTEEVSDFVSDMHVREQPRGLKIAITLMAPYEVSGEKIARSIDFFDAFREK